MAEPKTVQNCIIREKGESSHKSKANKISKKKKKMCERHR